MYFNPNYAAFWFDMAASEGHYNNACLPASGKPIDFGMGMSYLTMMDDFISDPDL